MTYKLCMNFLQSPNDILTDFILTSHKLLTNFQGILWAFSQTFYEVSKNVLWSFSKLYKRLKLIINFLQTFIETSSKFLIKFLQMSDESLRTSYKRFNNLPWTSFKSIHRTFKNYLKSFFGHHKHFLTFWSIFTSWVTLLHCEQDAL